MADEILKEFLNESREHLATIENDLLAIEEGGDNVDKELVNKVFRAAHSIKGGAGFLGLAKVKELAHKAETVLDMLRAGKMTPNAEITNVLLAAFDKLRQMINNPGEMDSMDTGDLLLSLGGLASSYLPQDQKKTLEQSVSLQNNGETFTLAQVDFDRARRMGQCIYVVEYELINDIERRGMSILQLFRELEESGEVLDCRIDFDAMGTLDKPLVNRLPLKLIFSTTLTLEVVPEILAVGQDKIKLLFDSQAEKTSAKSTPEPAAPAPVPAPAAEEPAPAPVARRAPAAPAAPTVPSAPSAPSAPPSGVSDAPVTADDTLRVNVGLLESLMNLAGELVLSRNQLRAAIAQNDFQSLTAAGQRLNQVTSELQDAVTRTRLQPVGNVFGKFPRVVRDLANSLNKDIHLEIEGKEVAMDRSLIEGISDPLTHMVRNAVDHGVETPEERARAGKRRTGTIHIGARHEAGQVVIEIADDGKGIDVKKVTEAAVSKGLITPERLHSMSEQDKLALIFLPGLSTAKTVTDVSGRGVGMDVVKTNLDRLGGKIEIKTEKGRGSLFRIKLPLTLAIIPSLIIAVGRDRFAIPQTNVEELLRIRADELKSRLEVVGGAEVLLLRDRILPLVRFDRFLNQDAARPLSEMASTTLLEIVVVTTGVLHYALVVGTFHDTEEIVVKPLGQHLKSLREYAGATILGDGAVALIVDVPGLAAKMELAAVSRAVADREEAEATEQHAEDNQSLLLFRNTPEEICAMPLNAVLRIERITPEQVEMVGNRRTFQYRGASLPLVTLADAAQVKAIGNTKELIVIVSSAHGREVGLIGMMPVDVVESNAVVDRTTHRQKGVAGSAIIHEKTTLMVDIFELVDAVFPDWGAGQEEEQPAVRRKPGNKIVLVAEDSDFFRAQVKRFLEEDGYTVFDAPDGEAAWGLLLQHADEVRAVVTDIEMPRMTGLQLTERIRANKQIASLPVIALTSLAGDEDAARGKAAGVTDYQVKLDRERLLASLHAIAENEQSS